MNLYKKLHSALVERCSGHRVVFHHLPKCGGTSIQRTLSLHYPFSRQIFNIDRMYSVYENLYPQYDSLIIRGKTVEFREHLLLYFMHCDVRLIAGHVRFSDLAYQLFSERYKFVTTLRDPLSWFMSFYFYNVTSSQERWKAAQSINEFLDTRSAQEWGSFFAAFYSGLPTGADPGSRESVERAKLNLSKLDAVGFVENMSAFQDQLRKILSVRISIGHENKARLARGDRMRVLDAADMEKVKEINKVNLEIYEFAQTRFAPGSAAQSL